MMQDGNLTFRKYVSGDGEMGGDGEIEMGSGHAIYLKLLKNNHKNTLI